MFRDHKNKTQTKINTSVKQGGRARNKTKQKTHKNKNIKTHTNSNTTVRHGGRTCNNTQNYKKKLTQQQANNEKRKLKKPQTKTNK